MGIFKLHGAGKLVGVKGLWNSKSFMKEVHNRFNDINY